MNVPHTEAMGVLIQADLDGELDAVQSADLTLHMAGCAECQALATRLRALKTGLRSGVPRYQAPDSLRLSLAKASDTAARPPRRRARLAWMSLGAPLGGFMAGAVLAAMLALAVLPIVPPEASRIAGEVASATLRADEPGHLLDQSNSAPAALAGWLREGLGYTPPVRAVPGFMLAGARLDYVHGRRVAVLVYRRDRRIVTLYLWPEQHQPTPPVSLAAAGIALSYWRADGMEFWATALSSRDVQAFAYAWRGSA
ncbi:MAG TPA: zf-HC2 domain-containing protein [Acetobacteraceae bacterium]|nr:zf-HC2 domain-containing protein [Acetobacteraceae bacterium]